MVSERTSGATWAARVVGVLVVLLGFLAWWGESSARRDPPLSGEIPGFLERWAVLTHLLPSLVLLVALVLAWKWPLVGAVAFGGVFVMAAIAAAVTVDVMYLVITGPHIVAGLLFLADWRQSRRAAVSAAST